MKLNEPSNLRGAGNGASLIIITRAQFIESVRLLRDVRQRQGLSVAIVDLEDVYDEFSFGHKNPQALKDFLSYARVNWQPAPQFVLFAGDASFDPKNYLGFGDYDFVPTRQIDTQYMETASDDWFADFNGDGVPELAVGRLPVRTSQEAQRMIPKII